ncbi:ABC transporter substrate-binding protein [Ferrigenium kumadai]|uniref:ABC transporter substrate-binding protein n=2 Tax=Ferrigenium kumadai TaxID=1682490 RepID=A0AAN1W0S5_9PROT|nr:ABC transporter substrate-binding protein [Ferrigenium kumadai]
MLLCGSASARPLQPAKVLFYYPIAVGGEIASVIDQRVAEFEAMHPAIDIEPIYSGTYKESLAKVLAANRAGTPPTLAVLHAVDLHTLIDADAIVPFDEFATTVDRDWLEDFEPAFMVNSRAGGKTWGIPFQRSTILLYWNKRAFSAAGLNPERPPQSWDEMRSMARRLTLRDKSGNVTRWGVQIPSSGFPYWLFQGWVTTNGGELMNAAGTETYFDQPAVIEALDYWNDLSRGDQVHPPGIIEWGSTPDDFLDERVSMIWTTSGNLANIARRAQFEFGVTSLPAHKRSGSPTGGGNFYVFKRSTPAQREAALEFIQWMTSPQQAAQWSMDTGYIPVRKSAWDVPLYRQYARRFPVATVAHAALEHSVPELSTHENQRVTKVLDEALYAALKGEKTPGQALREAQSRAMRILRPYQR